MQSEEPLYEHPVLRALEPGEEIKARAANIVVTDRRVAVASHEHLLLDIPIDRLRRIQFDIERGRPATLVLVPHQPVDEPQVLAIQPDEYPEIANALVVIGQRLAQLD